VARQFVKSESSDRRQHRDDESFALSAGETSIEEEFQFLKLP